MRILHLSSAKDFGGGERHLTDLTRGLHERGHEVFVALRPFNNWEERLNFLPTERFFHLPLRNSVDVLSARRIAKFVLEKNIEILHAHVARDYPIAALASNLSRAPLVLTRHLTRALNPVHRLTLKQASRVIAVSKGVAESLTNKKLIAEDKISVIHNGVDTKAYEKSAGDAETRARMRKKLGFETELLVATAGELREHKGQADFIRAAAILAKEYSNAVFLIAGRDNSKNQHFQAFLEDLVENLHLKKQVVFAGWQSEMAEFYAAVDIFVSAAQSEPFGLVIVEAMASAMPVVATATVGAAEILKNNETGRIVPIKNTERLADAIGELLKNEGLRRFLGENARIEAGENFSLERMTDETEKVYRMVTKSE